MWSEKRVAQMTARKGAGRPRTHDGGGQRMSIYLSKEQADFIRARAKDHHVTISASFQEIIDACMHGGEVENLKVAEDGDE